MGLTDAIKSMSDRFTRAAGDAYGRIAASRHLRHDGASGGGATAIGSAARGGPVDYGTTRGPAVDSGFWMRLGLDAKGAGLADPYGNHPWVHRALEIIANNLLDAPFVVENAVTDEFDPIDPSANKLAELFSTRPNPGQTPDVFWALTVLWMYIHGECFWILDRQFPSAEPQAIWPWAGGDRWQILEEDEMGLPTRWRVVMPGGKVQDFESWQIVQLKFADPKNPRRGLSPLKAGQTFINTDILAAEFNELFFRHGAQPGGFLKFEGRITPEQRRSIWNNFMDRHGNIEGSWRPGILEQGADWIPASLTHDDMLFLEQFKWDRDGIAGLLGVPKFLLSVDEDVTKANADSAISVLWTFTLVPLTRIIEMSVNAQLFSTVHKAKYRGKFDKSRVIALQGNQKELWETATLMWNDGVPMEQINERLGLEIEPYPGWNKSWVPVGKMTAEQAMGDVELPGAPADPAPPADDDIDIDAEPEDDRAAAADAGYLRSLPAAERRGRREDIAFWRTWNNKVLARGEGRMRPMFKKYLSALMAEQFRVFDAFVDDGPDDITTVAASARNVEISDLENLLFSEPEWAAILEQAYRPTVTYVASLSEAFTAAELLPKIGPSTVTIAEPPFQAYMEQRVASINTIPKRIHTTLSKTLSEGIQRGETIAQLRTRIESVDTVLKNPARSLMIARTESAAAANGTRFIYSGEVGVDFHRWVTAGDERVRSTHRANEIATLSEPIPIGQPFPANGLLYPSDAGGAAGEVINCRCIAILVVRRRQQNGVPSDRAKLMGKALTHAAKGTNDV